MYGTSKLFPQTAWGVWQKPEDKLPWNISKENNFRIESWVGCWLVFFQNINIFWYKVSFLKPGITGNCAQQRWMTNVRNESGPGSLPGRSSSMSTLYRAMDWKSADHRPSNAVSASCRFNAVWPTAPQAGLRVLHFSAADKHSHFWTAVSGQSTKIYWMNEWQSHQTPSSNSQAEVYPLIYSCPRLIRPII